MGNKPTTNKEKKGEYRLMKAKSIDCLVGWFVEPNDDRYLKLRM